MPIYKPPWKTSSSCSTTFSRSNRYDNLPGFYRCLADVREAILGEAAKLSEEVLQPSIVLVISRAASVTTDGRVTTPKGFKEAYKQVAEGGWLGLSAPTEYGGQGLPITLSQAVNEFQISANMAFSMYGGLTMGANGRAHRPRHARPEEDLCAENGGG